LISPPLIAERDREAAREERAPMPVAKLADLGGASVIEAGAAV
jgi:hypothetical protein